MLLRNIILTALIASVIAGLTLGVLQSFSTIPVIYGAENYEVGDAPMTEAPHTDKHVHSSSGSDTEEWAPADGAERISYTFLANILIAFGHSLLLTSFMALMFLKFHRPNISWKSGLVVGFGGYLSFYLATVIGLAPEVPGTIVANLQDRQLWWTLTIITTITGLSTLYLASGAFKVIGFVFIVLPHVIGAPHPEIAGFLNQDPSAILALEKLEHQFLISTAWVNLVYWLILGAISGALANRFFKIGKPESAFNPA